MVSDESEGGGSSVAADNSGEDPSGVPILSPLAKFLPRFVRKKWRKSEPTHMIVPYPATPGPTSPAVTAAGSTLPSSLDLFCRFFTHEVWELLVKETNR